VNKNAVPFDKSSPRVTSGLRIGTPAVTTRGMKEREMKLIADLIRRVMEKPQDENITENTRSAVAELCSGFPIYDFMD
jgi:glycine hydroxymethyltransferase